jgi:hypothetical protein
MAPIGLRSPKMAKRKKRAGSGRAHAWREIYTAEPWYRATDEAPAEDMVLRVWTPEGKDPRARKVIHRGGGGRRRKFASQKVGRFIHCESSLEYDLSLLLEIDPDIESFCEQPMEIHYRLNGEIHEHVPDQLVHWKDTSCVIESKFRIEAEEPAVAARSALLARDLPLLGLGYRVLTEERIKKEPRLRNAEDIRYAGRQSIDDQTRSRILALVDSHTPVTWGGAITGELGERGREPLARLVREGVLWFDIEQELLPSTRFVRRTEGLKWNFFS